MQKVGVVGLGKMGGNIARKLIASKEFKVYGYDVDPKATEILAKDACHIVSTLDDLSVSIDEVKIVILSLPAGKIMEKTLKRLYNWAGEIVILDCSNSYFKDSIRRARDCFKADINFLDVGISGGIRGLENGYCMMVGGDKAAYDKVSKVFEVLAQPEGRYLWIGESGSGHYVKMIHNGVEYAMMQAYAEGFHVLNKGLKKFGIQRASLSEIAHLWNRGSVVRSWLLELIETALMRDPELAKISGYTEDTGEGRWTIQEAIDLDVPVPAISAALFERFHSRENPDDQSPAHKLSAALRQEFGGHAVKKIEKK